MKQFLLSAFLLLFVISVGNTQISFTPAEPMGSNDACDVVQVDMNISNPTSDELRLKWRIDRVDVPVEWTLQLCDAITCYAYGVEATPDGETRINVFNPDQSYTFMFKVKPNDVGGIGDFDLVLFNAEDESDVYSTIPIVTTITNCTSSNDEVDEISSIGLFPNPTFGTFKLTEQTSVDRISVYNIIGKEVVSFSATSDGNYDVSDLENGMFLVRLFDQKGETIKVLRLSKR